MMFLQKAMKRTPDALAEEQAEPVDAEVADKEEGEANTETDDPPVAGGDAEKTADGVVDAAPVAPPPTTR